MLGCQDFCGYYDWTFHHVRRAFGPGAVEALWAEAIGADAQVHYLHGLQKGGLGGLLRVWQRTGEDEHCDWTFTLDEQRNVLRWDMRACPSKGFLQAGDRNADEDYCDHCMGWIVPLLSKGGVQVNAHEHNHCGQCWGELSVAGKPTEPLQVDADIRRDPRWKHGWLDRWMAGSKVTGNPFVSPAADPGELLAEWFAATDHLVVLGRGPSAGERWVGELPDDAVIITGTSYVKRDVFQGDPLAVLIGDTPGNLSEISSRFLTTPPDRRPLLMHAYLPLAKPADFISAGLPRPIPILPLLIRQGLYQHQPGGAYPTTGVFMVLLAAALGKRIDVAGIDLYQHPSGSIYADESVKAGDFVLPARHSRECDLRHLCCAIRQSQAPVNMPEHLRSLIAVA